MRRRDGGSAREALWLICIAVALTQASWGLIIPVLPVYAKEFHASAADLGAVVAAFSLARLLINVPAGLVADRVSQRKLIGGAIGAVAIIQLATSAATSLTYLLVMRLLLGFAGGVAITVGQAMIAGLSEGPTRGRSMARLQALQLAAAAFGPAVGGIVAGEFGVRASYLLSAVIALLVALGIVWRLPDLPRSGRGAGFTPPADRSLLRNQNFVAICVVGFTVFFARFGGQQTLVALVAYTKVNLSTSTYGVWLSALALINLGTVAIVGRISDRTRKLPIIASLLASGLAYAAFATVNTRTSFFVVLVILGASNELSGPVPASYCADVVPAALRGRGFGIYRTFADGGGLLGPIVLGFIIDRENVAAAALATAIVSIVAAVIFWALAKETVGRRAKPPFVTRIDRH